MVFFRPRNSVSRFAYGPWKLGGYLRRPDFDRRVVAVHGAGMRAQGSELAGETKPVVNEASENNCFLNQPRPLKPRPHTPSDDASTPATNPERSRPGKERTGKRVHNEEARLRAKAAEANASSARDQSIASHASPTAPTQSSSSSASKKVVVQVTYDENGRVTQATGNDPTALRIARQKRFPRGKAGSATVTIPIN